ncbi:hypothetical protein [Streptomyces sp. F-7]|uniref:hypothetical protein n=1 Tax=Streptomyces sp. F-7 TaxID=573566 RepID=UPI000AF46E80|nr:hypothetical protein [Streptomyces sp. F-7]
MPQPVRRPRASGDLVARAGRDLAEEPADAVISHRLVEALPGPLLHDTEQVAEHAAHRLYSAVREISSNFAIDVMVFSGCASSARACRIWRHGRLPTDALSAG